MATGTLLIVLTLTGTPTATSLCIANCVVHTSPGAEGASGHHEGMTPGGTPSLAANEHKCDELLRGAPFVRGDLQRVASGPASDHAVVMTRRTLGGEEANERPFTSAWGQPPSFRPCDSAVLRL
jgi:hypothetical protein